MVLGAGAVYSVALSAYRYSNGLTGQDAHETDEDEVERKERMKKQRRRPLSETLEQLGEGRGEFYEALHETHVPILIVLGIYGPGYEERRRERLLKTYGIDVKAAQEQFKAENVDPTASL